MYRKIILYLILVVNPIVIGLFWWQANSLVIGNSLASAMLSFGRLAGLVSVYGVLLQVLLIGRTTWVEKVFGLDRLARAHHYNGVALLFSLLAHAALVISSYAMLAQVSVLQQIVNFLYIQDVLKAHIALAIFMVVIVYSILIVRKKWNYEWWRLVHLLVYIAVILAFSHQLALGEDFQGNRLFVAYWYALYAFVFGNWFVYRVATPLYRFWAHQFRVSRVVQENHNVVSIYITGKNLSRLRIRGGQFGIFRFLDNRRWWQAHPFSFSMVPTDTELRITVKSVGDFTAAIKTLAAGTPVIMEGPFGIFTAEQAETEKLLLIAGGIGITPIRSMVESAVGKKDITVLYNCRTEQDAVLWSELSDYANRFKFPLHLVLSEQAVWDGERGKISHDIIDRLVPDAHDRDVYVCGPSGMMRNIVSLFKGIGVPRERIHFEKFSLH